MTPTQFRTDTQVARTYMFSFYPSSSCAYSNLRIAFDQRRNSRWHARQFERDGYVFRHLKGL